jgi:hypothetical protein
MPAVYKAILAMAAIMLCLIWIDNIANVPIQIEDLSTADLEMALLMESEYLITERLGGDSIEAMETSMTKEFTTSELELEILNDIENLDLWYD